MLDFLPRELCERGLGNRNSVRPSVGSRGLSAAAELLVQNVQMEQRCNVLPDYAIGRRIGLHIIQVINMKYRDAPIV